MVKKVLRFFIYLLFFILMLLYFMPKENLYYFLEKELKKEDVVISKESIKDNGFTLLVSDADISIRSIDSAVVSESNVGFYIVYNFIKLQDIELSSALKSFIPTHIDKVDITYSIFKPLEVQVYADGTFGILKGSFDLLKFVLHISLKPSRIMLKSNANTLNSLKKGMNGEFSYDQAF